METPIKASDLRQGNYIQTACGYEQVIDVMCDCLNTMSGTHLYADIMPVKIDPEILLKAGFTNEIEEELPEDAEFLCFFKDNIDVELQPALIGGYDVAGITLYEDAVDTDGQLVSEGKYEVKAEIKYLHQLQNLYWCLCCKELEINLQ